MTKKSSIKKQLSPPKSSKGDKSPSKRLSASEVKEQITGIEQPGRRNKQERIQAEISGDIDNAISADEVRPTSDSSRPLKKRRRA